MNKCTQEIEFIKGEESAWSVLEKIARERARKQKSLGIVLPDSSQKQILFVFPLSLFGVLIYCNLGCLINKLFIIILLYEQILIKLPDKVLLWFFWLNI